ncbi:MAG: tetratricopeptide repeat protein [Candidatus Hydrogenedens sp.]
MSIDCGSNSCSIQKDMGIVSGVKSIITHPNSHCPLWNSFLIVIIISVFGQVVYFDFIYYDDYLYTVSKAEKGDLWTYSFLHWAITSTDDGFWAPITKISHRIDTYLFVNKAGGHHAINILFHIINSLLLWRFLCRITGDKLVQFLSVCIFAIHPMHVEPVSWIASRKDLLCTFFLLLMLLKYIDWQEKGRKKDYLLLFIFFLCSAMSKPVSITFPLLLPVLDLVISGKNSFSTIKNFIFYIPFFIVSLFLLFITIHSEQEAIIPVSLTIKEWTSRIIASLSLYFILTFIPTSMHIPYGAEYYPFFGWTKGIPVYDKFSILTVAIITNVLFTLIWILIRRKYRENLLSFSFFILPLLPVIGIIPFGDHLIADRFSYIPHIGLCILICTSLTGVKKMTYMFSNIFLSFIIVLFSITSKHYTSLWENSEKLFRNTLKYEPNNYIALCNLGSALVRQGRYTESISHLQKAIEVYPLRVGPYNDLAFSYLSLGRYNDALTLYEKSLQISGGDPEILSNVSYLFFKMGNYQMSKEYAEKALKVNPGLSNARKILELLRTK